MDMHESAKKRRNTITNYSISEEAVIGNSREKKENYDLMTKTLESGVSGMCNLSKGIWDKARDNAKLEDIRNLMKKLNLTVDESMDILEIPEEERDLYREELKKDMAVLA